jgi:hypothetical protein
VVMESTIFRDSWKLHSSTSPGSSSSPPFPVPFIL